MFDASGLRYHGFDNGVQAKLMKAPAAQITYPAFQSKNVIYGVVQLGGEYFDIDSGVSYHFAIDESNGNGTGFDRMYFDVDSDKNIVNDTFLSRQSNPPALALRGYSSMKEAICFDNFMLKLPDDPVKTVPIAIMPRLRIGKSGSKSVAFVSAQLKQGRLSIEGKAYTVYLGFGDHISGRFSAPHTDMLLTDGDSSSSEGRGRWLNTFHKLGEEYYQFSADLSGDRVFVKAYEGKFGVFKLGPGNRDIKEMTANGILMTKTHSFVIGRPDSLDHVEHIQQCALPVGDYLPKSLEVYYGSLRLDCYARLNRRAGPLTYGIHIREDKPFVMDFSNECEVVFNAPGESQRVKVGQVLDVNAILCERELEYAFYRIYATSPSPYNKKRKSLTMLNPTVTIRRQNEDVVSTGTMHFG